jgi:hypothetical protein
MEATTHQRHHSMSAAATQKPPPVPRPETSETVLMNFRLPPSLVQALERYAEKQEVTKVAALRHLLAWALEKAGEEPE